jgi:amino-acid N-acetyltransferase
VDAKVELKKATDANISSITELLRSNGLPYEDIRSKIDCLFMGYLGPRVVGVGGVETYGIYGMLRSLVIEESFRRRGYGTTLCKKLIEHARLNGIDKIYLLTTTAEGFFDKIGFQRIERDKAPTVIQNTTEFLKLCPSSAVCMCMDIE